MDIAIRLSCILALLFCLASTGNAGPIDQDRQRLQELQRQSEQNSDPNAQVRITHEAVEIYKKYRGKAESDAGKEDELNSKVEEFESNIVLVEGVPIQGSGFLDFFKSIVKGQTKPKSSPTQTIVKEITKFVLGKLFGN